ncbi:MULTISPECIES: PLP-dependent aminotransferase family protein [unclassified Phaeobacter]|uniref:MocR-like pyridoxine biosynthesis transcription factor PdxR n=1 Tax=unclassified Phaeobacter TaxID=2621772 RepID=UPI003A8A8525
MARTLDGSLVDSIQLDRAGDAPLHRQLYGALRDLILNGRLSGDTRLPSSRVLTSRLGVSRFTVLTALEQLIAEGYLRTVPGGGTYVQNGLARTRARSDAPSQSRVGAADTLLSNLARNINWYAAAPDRQIQRLLNMALPDSRLFPVQTWTRLTKQVYSQIDTELGAYSSATRVSSLEEQIAKHLVISRGMQCDPEQVVSTFGAHHAVSLLSEFFLDKGDTVAFEEPGMHAIRSIFLSQGCTVVPIHVDQDGPNPDSVPKNARPKLAFVTAAKQQPMNIAMPVKRKLEFLNWADENNVLIIEDDLGSEFRYQGQPIPPLKALDKQGRVIFVGAFSNSMLQTLRIGYAVLPHDLAREFRNMRAVRYRAMPQLTEAVMAKFIEEGHYARHLYKVRREYAQRQKALSDILANKFRDIFEPQKPSDGFYIVCMFRDQSRNDEAASELCNQHGLGVTYLSGYYREPTVAKKGLLIGFAASTPREITGAAPELEWCLRNSIS